MHSYQKSTSVIKLFIYYSFFSCLNVAGSKFPFVNMQGTSQNNNWPMPHMGFQNQNNSDGFSHQTNNQHKSAGMMNTYCKIVFVVSVFVNIITESHSRIMIFTLC